MTNPVKERAFKIVEKSKDVKINKERIGELAKSWENTKTPEWPEYFHFKSLDYFFILDSINFCFWPQKDKKWSIDYEGKNYNGYFALSLS